MIESWVEIRAGWASWVCSSSGLMPDGHLVPSCSTASLWQIIMMNAVREARKRPLQSPTYRPHAQMPDVVTHSTFHLDSRLSLHASSTAQTQRLRPWPIIVGTGLTTSASTVLTARFDPNPSPGAEPREMIRKIRPTCSRRLLKMVRSPAPASLAIFGQ